MPATEDATDGPFGRSMRNRTIGGLAIDFAGEPKLDWLRWALQAYVDELAMYVTHDIGGCTDAELDLAVTELLQRVADCKSFADLPDCDTQSESVRIAGALRLRLLHETVDVLRAGRFDIDTMLVWNRMSLTTREAATLWAVSSPESGRAAISEQARKAATVRHEQGPFAEVRHFARDQLRSWEREPSMYQSLASFARDIADKFPIVTNPVSVERWVRGWRVEDSAQG